MFGDIHNTRCVDNDNLCILSVLKERKKAFPAADVSLIISYAGIPYCLFVGKDLPAHGVSPCSEFANQGASQMAGSASHQIKLFHRAHSFQIADILLITFAICIIIVKTSYNNRQT